MRSRLLLAATASWVLLGLARGQEAAARSPALSGDGWWRQCCRFGADRVSRNSLESEGQQILGERGIQRLQKQTEERLRRSGVDPSTVDWRDRVFVWMFFDRSSPDVSPPVPSDWMMPEFDDSSWVLERGPFHEPAPGGQRLPMGPGWTRDDLDQAGFSCLGVQSCHYRARFVVDEPAEAGDLTLGLAYRGGARAFINGREAARGHLPAGAPDAPAEDYPQQAYGDQPELRDRSLGPVTIPPGLLRRGINLLAIEVRASRLHPVVLNMKLAMHNHKVRQGMVGVWRHCGLVGLELRSASRGVASGLSRPPGVQVWVQDSHHRVDSTEFLPAGEPAGVVRFVGARNGTYGAQVVVGTDKPLGALHAEATELRHVAGGARIPATSFRVSHVAPYPAAAFTEAKLGDDRGLGATFPDRQLLARFESLAEPGEPHVFDHLTPTPPRSIPGDSCRPIWLSLRIPAEAEPGAYRGTVAIEADGMPRAQVPVEAEVVGWRLPEPTDFQTFVGCEQNPYGVAKHYGVPLWSDAHFQLLEASFRQLGRVGNKWLNVPVISRTEFGNRDDSMIRWRQPAVGGMSSSRDTRRGDTPPTGLAFDYAILDRYLDLAARHCGPPRVINFVVMQGMKSVATPPARPSVQVFDERSAKTLPLALDGVPGEQKRATWAAFATSLFHHMKARGIEKAMYWGYPLEQEDDPELKSLLERCTPGVHWAANPHELLWNAVYAKDRHYQAIVTVRYQPGARSLPEFRADRGWKSPMIHLLNPRTGGNILAIHTVSHPFAFRALVDHALAHGHSGISRVGADEWAAIHYDGMVAPRWLTGMPVLFLLWPGSEGAESSIRFEALVEGVQEAEARIFLEQAIDSGRLPPDLAKRVTSLLARHLQETLFLQGTLCVHELEKYHCGWQDRSRRLYRGAAEVAAVLP